MEKGPSTLVEYWSYEGSDIIHCIEHAGEFGLNTDDVETYNSLARTFIRVKEKGNLLFQKQNGSIYKYNPNTKQFGIYSKSGKLVTFYKTSLRYFLNEFKKSVEAKWLYGGDE